jgi:cell division transport system ATP-binding protein
MVTLMDSWKPSYVDSVSIRKKFHNPATRGFPGTIVQIRQTRMVHVQRGAYAPPLVARGGVRVIRFENVSKTYKNGTPALKDISLDIEKGEFVFLVGASGSGKTTFLRLLLREELPDQGRILEAGRDIGELPKWRVPYLRRNIGCVFQDFRLLPNKTVFENVAFALEVIGRPRTTVDSQVPQILDLVGLSDKSKNLPGELSGGEQQRVAVARAFVNRPLILLADEPTGNLDPANSESIMALLERINRTGTTVVMATHDKALVDRMRRRVIELDKGEMIRDQVRGVYGIDEGIAI